jgi:polyhydroxyalkanoate synthesis regulator phasin
VKTKTRLSIAAFATASVLGGGVAGVVLSSPVAAIAQEDSTADVADTRADALQDALAGLVSDGTITQAQADAVAEALAEAMPARGGHHGRHLRGAATAADVIGIDVEPLAEALRDGATIAEVASDNGVEPQAVIDALVAEAMERLDQAVEDGRLSADEAADKEADIAEHITDLVNGELERPEFGRRGPGRGFGAGGEEAPAANAFLSA